MEADRQVNFEFTKDNKGLQVSGEHLERLRPHLRIDRHASALTVHPKQIPLLWVTCKKHGLVLTVNGVMLDKKRKEDPVEGDPRAGEGSGEVVGGPDPGEPELRTAAVEGAREVRE